MTSVAENLARTRAARQAARERFDARLAQVRADLAARDIRGRIADKAKEQAVDALDEALEIAGESKGIIAAMLAALALWFLRNPIIAFLSRHLSKQGEPDEVQEY